ncbi:MAG: hypothetical protein J6T12_03755 [Salinivirgaceae bacterium]|nr:hypothetical protein [Salinivirgaceae bacterium]
MKLISNIFRYIFLVASLFFVNLSVASDADADSDTDWVLVTEDKDNDIKVFERWISLDKQRARERSGKMILKCSPEELLAIISDPNKTDIWMSNVESCRIVRRTNSTEWFVYTLMDAPWPIGKQDFVSKYTVTRRGDRIIVSIDQQTDLIPKKKDIERLDTFSARWEIMPVSESTISVVFTTQSTQPSKYPNWAQDPIVRKTFLNNMRKLRRHINKTA